jgi:hypothetical protein
MEPRSPEEARAALPEREPGGVPARWSRQKCGSQQPRPRGQRSHAECTPRSQRPERPPVTRTFCKNPLPPCRSRPGWVSPGALVPPCWRPSSPWLALIAPRRDCRGPARATGAGAACSWRCGGRARARRPLQRAQGAGGVGRVPRRRRPPARMAAPWPLRSLAPARATCSPPAPTPFAGCCQPSPSCRAPRPPAAPRRATRGATPTARDVDAAQRDFYATIVRRYGADSAPARAFVPPAELAAAAAAAAAGGAAAPRAVPAAAEVAANTERALALGRAVAQGSEAPPVRPPPVVNAPPAPLDVSSMTGWGRGGACPLESSFPRPGCAGQGPLASARKPWRLP